MGIEDLFGDHYHKPSNCDECGVPLDFKGLGTYKCRKCGKILYDDFGKVRKYLDEHHQANIAQIHAETGVDEDSIRRMLKEERLEVTKESKTYLTCEGCGKPIRYGLFCESCAKLHEAAKEKRKKEQQMMDKKDLIHVLGKAMAEGGDGKRRFDR